MEIEQPRRAVPISQAVRYRIPAPVRFGLYLVLASTPLLAISAEVFGVVSLRAVSSMFLFPLLAILAVLVVLNPDGIDRTAFAGFAWGLAACAGYDSFRLPTVYVFGLWGDFFGRIGGWATGTSSDYLAGYLWRYLGDGAGIGVVVFILAAALGSASWPRRQVIGFTVAFAICPVWAGLVLTDGLAPAGRALFPLNATTLILSLAGHLIYGAILGWGLWASRHRPGQARRAGGHDLARSHRAGRGGRGGNRSATSVAGRLRGDSGPGGGMLRPPRDAADVPGDDRGDADGRSAGKLPAAGRSPRSRRPAPRGDLPPPLERDHAAAAI